MSVVTKISKLNIISNGKPVMKALFTKTNKKSFSRDDVKKIAQDYSNDLKEKKFKGTLRVNIKIAGKGYRSNGWDAPGKKISLFKFQDYPDEMDKGEDKPDLTRYSEFEIYFKI